MQDANGKLSLLEWACAVFDKSWEELHSEVTVDVKVIKTAAQADAEAAAEATSAAAAEAAAGSAAAEASKAAEEERKLKMQADVRATGPRALLLSPRPFVVVPPPPCASPPPSEHRPVAPCSSTGRCG